MADKPKANTSGPGAPAESKSKDPSAVKTPVANVEVKAAAVDPQKTPVAKENGDDAMDEGASNEVEEKDQNNSQEEEQDQLEEQEHMDDQEELEAQNVGEDDEAAMDVDDGDQGPADEDKPADGSEVREELRVHPYQQLLDEYEPTAAQMSKTKKFVPKPLNDVPCVLVETKPYFEELCEQLMLEKEIGVGAKFNLNNYQSRMCLLLLSTRESNYLIDCIKLKQSMHLLQPVMANPDVVKVVGFTTMLRGLQMDLNLWCVNVFSLSVAFKKLGWRKPFFQYIETAYGVRVNQKLTGWHTRPLRQNHKTEAASNVHYLLPIYTTTKNELIDAKQLRQVLIDCNKHCGHVYRPRDLHDPQMPSIGLMPANQAAIMCALHEWRHEVGRKKNRNIYQVLSNAEMKQLAIRMPMSVMDILEISNGVQVQNHVNDIQRMIMRLRKVIGPVNDKQNLKRPGGATETDEKDGANNADNKDAGKEEGKDKPKNKAKNKEKAAASVGASPKQKWTRGRGGGMFNKSPRGGFKNKQGDSFPHHFQAPGRGRGSFSKTGTNNWSRGASSSRFPPSNRGRDVFKRGSGNFGDRRSGPSPKRAKISPWGDSSHQNVPQVRSDSPPSYLILSNKGEAFQLAGTNPLSSILGPNRAQSGDSFPRSGGRAPWQNAPANSGGRSNNTWNQPNVMNNPLNSIDTLLNLSSTLMGLNNRDSYNGGGGGGGGGGVRNRSDYRDREGNHHGRDGFAFEGEGGGRNKDRSNERNDFRGDRFDTGDRERSFNRGGGGFDQRRGGGRQHQGTADGPGGFTKSSKYVPNLGGSRDTSVVSYPLYNPSRYSRQGF